MTARFLALLALLVLVAAFRRPATRWVVIDADDEDASIELVPMTAWLPVPN